MTVKIDDKTADDLLAAKVQTVKAIAAQILPEKFLGGSHIFAKMFRAIEFCGVDGLSEDAGRLHGMKAMGMLPR